MLGVYDDTIFNLSETKCAIEDAIDKLERGMKARDVERKQVLLSEMKRALAMLAETDKKIVKDLKVEAFDKIRCMSKVIDEATSLDANTRANSSIKKKKN